MSTHLSFHTARLHRLVDGIQQGDPSAQEELLRQVTDRLECLARKMLHGFPGVRRFEETGDVLQSALMRLLRALEAVKPASTRDFFNLAAEQIRRQLLDLNRHYYGVYGAGRHLQQQRAANPDGGETAILEPGESDDGTAHSEDLDRWGEFHQAVEQLSAEEREVVGLTFYHGWTQQQIAELLQVNVRTVRRYWQAACLRLNELVGGRLPAADLIKGFQDVAGGDPSA